MVMMILVQIVNSTRRKIVTVIATSFRLFDLYGAVQAVASRSSWLRATDFGTLRVALKTLIARIYPSPAVSCKTANSLSALA